MQPVQPMDDFFDLPTLIVIGLAIVVLFRLRSVLGTRTGNERTPLERAQAPKLRRASRGHRRADAPARHRRRPMLDDERRARKVEAEIEQFSRGNAEMAAGLKAIAEADPELHAQNLPRRRQAGL